ncbi:MAG: hypothetical protein H6Q00_1833 [Holophagaceae bacterium]|nr:hypothetical protein [Holophagaceae bacterium]
MFTPNETIPTPLFLTFVMGAGGVMAVPVENEEHAIELLRDRTGTWTEGILSASPGLLPIKTWVPTQDGVKEVNE